MERDVASMYSDGATYTDIANLMDRSPNTIKTILHRIKTKLQVKNARSIIKEVRINKIL